MQIRPVTYRELLPVRARADARVFLRLSSRVELRLIGGYTAARDRATKGAEELRELSRSDLLEGEVTRVGRIEKLDASVKSGYNAMFRGLVRRSRDVNSYQTRDIDAKR